MTTTRQSHEKAALGYGDSFRVRVISQEDGHAAVALFGELDIVSMPRFERVIASVLSRNPKSVIFDLTHAEFVSIQGYAAIGQCSIGVRVVIRSRTDLASRILGMYGYDRVAVTIGQDPAVPRGFTDRQSKRHIARRGTLEQLDVAT